MCPCHLHRYACADERPRGFTIVELLVVVGIIAILMGLLIVGVGAVTKSARTSACLAQLRELSNAHVAYSNLYGECFVDVGLPHGGSGDPKRSFVTLLRDFGMSAQALKSPLDQSAFWPPEMGGDGSALAVVDGEALHRRTSYGMNAYLSRTYSPALATGNGTAADRHARVARPERVVCFLLMAEKGPYASSDHPHVENWGAVNPPAAIAATQVSVNAIDRRKPSGDSTSNWSFVDGHVATQRFETLFVSSSENRFDPALSF